MNKLIQKLGNFPSPIMTLQEAIDIVNKKPCNVNLNWFISEWNGGYIIHSSTYMERNPGTIYIYSKITKHED
jgi:hypothetical protein